jgi:hypothetical protein
MKFLFDAHLDLSMNALEWNRDFRQEISMIRSLLFLLCVKETSACVLLL